MGLLKGLNSAIFFKYTYTHVYLYLQIFEFGWENPPGRAFWWAVMNRGHTSQEGLALHPWDTGLQEFICLKYKCFSPSVKSHFITF